MRASNRALPLLAILPLFPILVQGALVALHRAHAIAEKRPPAAALSASQKALLPGAIKAREHSLALCHAFAPEASLPLTVTVDAAQGTSAAGGGTSPSYWFVDVTDTRDNRFVARLIWEADTGRLRHMIRAHVAAEVGTIPKLDNTQTAQICALGWLNRLGDAPPPDRHWKIDRPVTKMDSIYRVHATAPGGSQALVSLDAASGLPLQVSVFDDTTYRAVRNKP